VHDVGDRVGHELQRTGLGLRHPEVLDVRARRRRDVQHDLADLERRDAVDHGLVGLGDDRGLVLLQALDQVDLPQRAGVVERARHQARDQVVQLRLVARFGQGAPANVVGDVEVGVVDPHGACDASGDVHDLLPVARHEAEALLDEVDELVVVEARLGPSEHRHPADVHRRLGVLQVQERGVQR
jgi:hypothetical protein